MGELSKLPNIGKAVEAQLIQVGIETPEALREIGAKAAWLKIQEIDPSACIHRLLALEGAIQGVKKTGLPDAVKADLKRPRCYPAACRSGGQSAGHRQYGAVPGFRQSRFHHRREHLHRWRSDPAYDLPWRQRLDTEPLNGKRLQGIFLKQNIFRKQENL